MVDKIAGSNVIRHFPVAHLALPGKAITENVMFKTDPISFSEHQRFTADGPEGVKGRTPGITHRTGA